MPTTSVESEIKEAGEDIEKLKKLIHEKDKEIIEQEGAISDLTNLYEKEKQKHLNLQETLKKLQEELNKCQKSKEEIEKELEKCQKENESNKDCQEELEKCKKRQEELEKELEKCLKDKEELEKNEHNGLWIIGEYRTMPVGSQMPEGWVKIELEDGYTLVQGSKNDRTLGEVKSHSHTFLGDTRFWSIIGPIWYHNVNMNNSTPNKFFPSMESVSQGACLPSTDFVGDSLNRNQKANLIAGMCTELWQYQGKKQ